MDILNTPDLFAERINELSFLLGILVSIFFYMEYKKCDLEIKKKDMIDQFLND